MPNPSRREGRERAEWNEKQLLFFLGRTILLHDDDDDAYRPTNHRLSRLPSYLAGDKPTLAPSNFF